MLKKIINNILDYIFPQFCLNCKKEGKIICNTCIKTIKILSLENNISIKDKYFNKCYICCEYNNILIQNIIKKYKYNYIESLSKYLIDILYKQIIKIELNKNTIITNIPLHKKKKKERGFDQIEILAKELAKKLNIEYIPVLKRIKYTKVQAKLKKEERIKNISNSFIINNKIKTNTIILVDDIMTTGETLNQASKVLKQLNINKIITIVIAKNS